MLLLTWSLIACRPPPEAPEDLDAIAAFLFERHLVEDGSVELGMENLRAWFEREFDPEANRGFELTLPLSQAAVDTIDGSTAWSHPRTKPTRETAEMAGAAAGTVGAHAVDAYIDALVTVPQDEVLTKTFEEWGRTWRLCTGEAFSARECALLESDEQQSSAFGLGMRTTGEAYNQYRDLTLSDGARALNHRNWQLYPPEVSSNLLEVADQYYLNAFVPSTDGSRVFRFQATWAVFGDKVPRDIGLNLTARSMAESSEQLDAWLEAHP